MNSTTPPPPPYDRECDEVLRTLPLMPPLTAETIPIRRELAPAPRPDNERLSCGGRYVVEERHAPGPEGSPEVPLLLCRPSGVPTPTPALYWIHGGGMVLGTYRDNLDRVLDLAGPVEAAVVSVEYRRAPETPHPGPVEDCYAGLVWLAAHAAELDVDRDRIVVGGGSAGGGLAAGVALLSRDRGGPALAGQLLGCPMIDDRNDTPSAHQMAELPMWNRSANEVGWTALLGDRRGTEDVSPYAAPSRARDLSGLPPAFLDVGSTDTFRDEDVDYAGRIWLAGGVAELHVWPGGYHGFDSIAPMARISQAAFAARVDWLRRLLL